MKFFFRNIFAKLRNLFLRGINRKIDILSKAVGRNSALSLQNYDSIDLLSDAGFQVFSQFDEDGILEWLIQRLPIASKRFVEFGVEDYTESNTRFLLKNRNWQGLVMDSSSDHIDCIRNDYLYWKYSLDAHCTFVTPENINELLTDFGFVGNIGVLSIDAGGMDYWIWKAINVVEPDIVICEYNSILGDVFPLVVPYQSDFTSTKVHYSGLYWGANAKAFEQLALEKNYRLVGSNIGGHNVFFVREDLFPVIDKMIKNKKPKLSLYRDSRSPDGKLTYIGGLKRFETIRHLPVTNLDTGELVKLESLKSVYSKEWLQES